ncbi:MAG: hypothetical protein VX252_02020 [Myxococcota bacterium]|nr:hypothetical protein [Myxococcota bacterium]
MRVKIKFLLSTAVATAALFLASTASASMHYFSEMLTSDLMTGAPNYQMILNANLDDSGNLSEVVTNTMTAGAGLGSASVSAGGSLSYTHSFGPADTATGIVGSQLSVLTSGASSSNAFTSISLDDNFWLNQATSFQVLGGQVDATLFLSDGELLVNVSATGNDLDLVWSMFRVNYEVDATRQTLVSSSGGGGDISAAIPEPGAATLFGAGILIVGSAIRRRSHES